MVSAVATIEDVETQLRRQFGLGRKDTKPTVKDLLSTQTRRYVKKDGTQGKRNSRRAAIALMKKHPDHPLTAEGERELMGVLQAYDQALWLVTQFHKIRQDTDPQDALGQAEARLSKLTTNAVTNLFDAAPTLVTPTYQAIQSDFGVVVNRRFQPSHFHMAAITTRGVDEQPGVANQVRALLRDPSAHDAIRKRWIKAKGLEPGTHQEFINFDVTASQLQILALVAGLPNLERAIKEYTLRSDLADIAWPLLATDPQPGQPGYAPYAGTHDARLQSLIKTLLMLEPYGSTVRHIVGEHLKDPLAFGLGWAMDEPTTDAVETRAGALMVKAEQAIRKFPGRAPLTRERALKKARRLLRHASATAKAQTVLDATPDREGIVKFLDACRRMAKRSWEKDGGLTLTDGLSHDPDAEPVRFRWDPVRYASQPVQLLDGFKVQAGIRKPPMRGNQINHKLKNMSAPCVIHSQDALFAGLVVEQFQARGITSFGTVHDSFYVPAMVRVPGEILPQPGEVVLQDALRVAAREWFKRLHVILDDMAEYLGDDNGLMTRPTRGVIPGWQDETYSQYVAGLRQRWEIRLAEAEADPSRWPEFVVK
jgi:hypothetical protein